jgi:hypothetical protein
MLGARIRDPSCVGESVDWSLNSTIEFIVDVYQAQKFATLAHVIDDKMLKYLYLGNTHNKPYDTIKDQSSPSPTRKGSRICTPSMKVTHVHYE